MASALTCCFEGYFYVLQKPRIFTGYPQHTRQKKNRQTTNVGSVISKPTTSTILFPAEKECLLSTLFLLGMIWWPEQSGTE